MPPRGLLVPPVMNTEIQGQIGLNVQVLRIFGDWSISATLGPLPLGFGIRQTSLCLASEVPEAGRARFASRQS